VELTHTFVASARSQSSLCHQMLMGSGKTTVVGPLVAMIVAESGSLVTSVVPASLLTFAQSVLKSTLVSTLHRRVLTLHFSRYTKVRGRRVERAHEGLREGFLAERRAASLARETASKTDETTLSWPRHASSAPWSSTPSLTALHQLCTAKSESPAACPYLSRITVLRKDTSRNLLI
jgi:hypothetical protein